MIGDGITKIGSSTFEQCKNLKKVVIGKACKEVGGSLFEGCSSMQELICLAENPPLVYDYLADIYTATLKVPIDAVSAYKSTEGWKNFYKIEGIDASNINSIRKKEVRTNIYSINGCLLHKNILLDNIDNYHLNKGIYIVDGKKIIVK